MILEVLNNKRKKLIFRSWHRGTREMDLLMGRFAERYVMDYTQEQLALYEEILNHPDPDLYDWVSGRTSPPANVMNPVLEQFLSHDFAR